MWIQSVVVFSSILLQLRAMRGRGGPRHEYMNKKFTWRHCVTVGPYGGTKLTALNCFVHEHQLSGYRCINCADSQLSVHNNTHMHMHSFCQIYIVVYAWLCFKILIIVELGPIFYSHNLLWMEPLNTPLHIDSCACSISYYMCHDTREGNMVRCIHSVSIQYTSLYVRKGIWIAFVCMHRLHIWSWMFVLMLKASLGGRYNFSFLLTCCISPKCG